MTIEAKRVTDRKEPRGNTLRTTVEFTGALYDTNLPEVVSVLPHHSQVDVVRFTTPTPKR